jgi:hypothetical protein
MAGVYSPKELSFCLGSHEKKAIGDIQTLMREIFGLEPDRINRGGATISIVYRFRSLAQFFAKHCGKGASNKHIPHFLFEAPERYFLELLLGYFRGNGSYNSKMGRDAVVSVSRQFILELHWLCRMHGIKTYLSDHKVKTSLPLLTAHRVSFGKRMDSLPARGAVVRNVKKMAYNDYVYDLCGCENEAFFGGENPILLHNTNRPDVLDPALLRPGRFDRKVVLDLPDKRERKEILGIHCKNKPLAKGVDIEIIAQSTAGMSGADLKNVVNEAAIYAARQDKKTIGQKDLIWAVEKVRLGPERKSKVLSRKEKKIIAYHEAGHAIIGHILPYTDPIHKISVISRGMTLGYTWSLPAEDFHLYSKEKFENQLVQMLGGRVAEKLKFKSITTGAANDLKQATKLARDMVTRFGMSDKLGPITLGEREELIFLGKELAEHKTYSEKIAALIDSEVFRIINRAERQAKDILIKYRKKLDKIALKLLDQETIEGKEFERFFK